MHTHTRADAHTHTRKRGRKRQKAILNENKIEKQQPLLVKQKKTELGTFTMESNSKEGEVFKV